MKTSEAVAIFGTKTALAKALRITLSAVSQWGEEVPPLRKYEIREYLERKAASDAVKWPVDAA